MPFQPGISGNPSGRRKMPEETKRILEEGGPEAFRFWLNTLRDMDAIWNQRDKAAERLASYWMGKPKEMIDVELEGRIEGFTINVVNKTDA